MTTLKEELERETDALLLESLEESAAYARERIIKEKDFSVTNVIPLLLRSQYNHIAHLDAEVTAIKEGMKNLEVKMDERFGKMDERFGKMDERFVEIYKSISDIHSQISNQTKWIFGAAVGIVAILSGLITLLKFI